MQIQWVLSNFGIVESEVVDSLTRSAHGNDKPSIFFGTLWRQDEYFERPCVYVSLTSVSPLGTYPPAVPHRDICWSYVTPLLELQCHSAFTCASPLKYHVRLIHNCCLSCGAHEDLEHLVLLNEDCTAKHGTRFAAFQKAGSLHLTVQKPIFPRGGRRVCQPSFEDLLTYPRDARLHDRL